MRRLFSPEEAHALQLHIMGPVARLEHAGSRCPRCDDTGWPLGSLPANVPGLTGLHDKPGVRVPAGALLQDNRATGYDLTARHWARLDHGYCDCLAGPWRRARDASGTSDEMPNPQAAVADQERQAAAERVRLLEDAHLPASLRNASETGFDWSRLSPDSTAAATRYLNQARERFVAGGGDLAGFYFCGSVGTGKTHLACAVLRACCLAGLSGLFVKSIDLLGAFRGVLDGGAREGDVMLRYSLPVLLVIDDLGTEHDSEWAMERLYAVVDRRATAGKPMGFTSNYTLDGLRERSGSEGVAAAWRRIVSRIRASCLQISFRGRDYRADHGANAQSDHHGPQGAAQGLSGALAGIQEEGDDGD